jgi:hypothetical protein
MIVDSATWTGHTLEFRWDTAFIWRFRIATLVLLVRDRDTPEGEMSRAYGFMLGFDIFSVLSGLFLYWGYKRTGITWVPRRYAARDAARREIG